MSYTPFAADEVFSRQAMNKRLGQVDLPRGIIAMWSGAASAIPTGWTLCDGANGTPDLRGRFVLGAGGTYGVGVKGGEEKHTLSESEMPNHRHGITIQGYGPGGCYGPAGSGDYGSDIYTGGTGGFQPHNNMPPYYALCYIMKL